jgi:hypothetical protein
MTSRYQRRIKAIGVAREAGRQRAFQRARANNEWRSRELEVVPVFDSHAGREVANPSGDGPFGSSHPVDFVSGLLVVCRRCDNECAVAYRTPGGKDFLVPLDELIDPAGVHADALRAQRVERVGIASEAVCHRCGPIPVDAAALSNALDNVPFCGEPSVGHIRIPAR